MDKKEAIEQLRQWADNAAASDSTCPSKEPVPCLSQHQISQIMQIAKQARSAPAGMPQRPLMGR